MTMTMRQIEPSLELRNSYVACIAMLEKDLEQITTALKVLRERLAEHEERHGFAALAETAEKEG